MNSICTNRWHSTLSFCIFVSSLESGEYILDRKLTFHQTAQFYLKYSLFFSFLQMCECLIVLWFIWKIFLENDMLFLSWYTGKRKKIWRELLHGWLQGWGGPFFTKVSSSGGGCWARSNNPQVGGMVWIRGNRCLFWMFHWNILNIEEVENWSHPQNSVFSQEIWCFKSA